MSNTPKSHDEVLLKKGPLGKDWSTRNEPYGRGSGGSGNRRRIDRKYSDSNRLATVQSTEWEEMQVFFKLCRGERLRVMYTNNNKTHSRRLLHQLPQGSNVELFLAQFGTCQTQVPPGLTHPSVLYTSTSQIRRTLD